MNQVSRLLIKRIPMSLVGHNATPVAFSVRSFASEVKVTKVTNTNKPPVTPTAAPKKVKDDCSTPAAKDDDDEEDMEEMFVQGPAGLEWGGPTRGGRRPEPTRFGDWERKGRATDFR